MNIKETFLNLTTHTVPYGKEIEYLKDKLPMDILKKDPSGNLYIKIGESTTMFTSHLDTVGGDKEINHVIEGNMIKTDGKSILGADDKSGVVIMLYMIEAGVPGLYVFFMGEEVGCKGSRALSTWIEKNKNDDRYKNINKVVSFDRKDVDSVITYQTGDRCCSDEFADSLIAELKKNGLNYRKDTGGVLTDSIQFTDLYAECTNLSVGYWSQHTNTERQDIEFLEKLSKACTKVNWEGLTVKRKPGESERLSYGYRGGRGYSYNTYGGSYYDDWEDDYSYGYSNTWRETGRSNNQYSSKSTAEYVTDWKGNKVPTKNTVWCEFDNVHCLKDEAIWVDLLGFYTTPDESTIARTSTDNKSYSDTKGDIVTDYRNLKVGDNVIHPSFGKGVIKNIIDDKKVEIDFTEKGRKQLLLKMAKIKKI